MHTKDMIKVKSFIPVRTGTEAGEVVIATLRASNLVDVDCIDEFAKEVEAYVMAHPGADFVLDFHRVHHLSSTILQELVGLQGVVTRNNGELSLCGFRDDIKDLLILTNMDSDFVIYPDLRLALQRYGSPAKHRVSA
jgi:anti-anti-sigma factor